MRLSGFILNNKEAIIKEWVEFATTLGTDAQRGDLELLRDHVESMLETIAADLCSPQTAAEEKRKSKGQDCDPNNTPAKTHGIGRLEAGFSLNSAMAEYRALRASITRLWQKALITDPPPEPHTITEDLVRFNEAIDQSISESVLSYSVEKEQQARMLDTILLSSPDLVFVCDLDGKLVYANSALTETLKLRLDKIVGENFIELPLPNVEELLEQIQQVASTNDQYQGEMSYRPSSGRQGFYDYILVPVLSKDGSVETVAGIARNITERKAAEEENWRRANYDLLTGLPNQRLFRDRLAQDVKYAGRVGAPLALLFIDLDHFKEANDQFGHDTGDVLLRLAADRIRSCVRETDTVARLGGDEFTVILHDLKDAEQAQVVAGKIVKEMANSFHISKEIVHISASIGIAVSSEDATTAEHLIKNADLAMYVAKNAGSNQFSFFSPTGNHTD